MSLRVERPADRKKSGKRRKSLLKKLTVGVDFS
jgi:hypothetical protein